MASNNRLTRCLHGKKYKLLKTGLNNAVQPILFNVVNNIAQHCHTRLQVGFRLNNLFSIVDNNAGSAVHCSILFSTALNVPSFQVVINYMRTQKPRYGRGCSCVWRAPGGSNEHGEIHPDFYNPPANSLPHRCRT